MPDPGRTIDRNEERLARLARGEAMQRARSRRWQRKKARVAKRLTRGAGVVIATVLGIMLWGLIVGPIGTTVLVLAVMLGLAAMVLALAIDPDRSEPRDVEQVAPAALPALTDAWLDRQRRQLPRLAAPQVDAISAKLATLEQQLAAVPEGDPVAQDVSRLLAKHLPELVDRYTRVPAEQRRETIESDGRSLDTTLVEGLRVVEEQLDRASRALAENDRDAVRIQGKFLEQRYRNDAMPG